MGKRAWGCILALAAAGFSMTATATDVALFSATDADLAALKDRQDVQSLLRAWAASDGRRTWRTSRG